MSKKIWCEVFSVIEAYDNNFTSRLIIYWLNNLVDFLTKLLQGAVILVTWQ